MIPSDPLRNLGPATILRADARTLPLADNSVDLIVTSPPYFALRSYQDGCPDCMDASKAHMRGYMERYCPGCRKVGTVQKCSRCDRTTLRTEATKAAIRKDADPNCETCGGTGKGHYAGQLGSEATPAEFVDALIDCTREMVRVVKPSGSIWVNLGDKYSGANAQNYHDGRTGAGVIRAAQPDVCGIHAKSLMGIPWRYALRCIDDLGLILRAEVIWDKPNGLPESVTDRVRRSHEQWFHFVLEPRYYSAVDEIRETYAETQRPGVMTWDQRRNRDDKAARYSDQNGHGGTAGMAQSPLGKLPGSVWTIPTEPLRVPDHLGIQHFAAFPSEWPKRIIRGWSPAGVCTACGEGRRPVTQVEQQGGTVSGSGKWHRESIGAVGVTRGTLSSRTTSETTITGYACACTRCLDVTSSPGGQIRCWLPMGHQGMHAIDFENRGDAVPPTTPALILDPFGGTGTVAMVARALGRHGIHADLSQDYNRLARWRITDLDQLAAVQGHARTKRQPDDQPTLLDEIPEVSA